MAEPIGSILIKAGLITHDELERARAVRELRGGRLGPIIAATGAATQAQIDQAWVAVFVTPALEQAIDRECGNKFSGLKTGRIHYRRVERVRRITENMLNGAELSEANVEIDGTAALEIGGRLSLDFEFNLDCGTGFALIADRSIPIVRRWFDLLDRNGWLTDESAEPNAKPSAPKADLDSFADSVNKLLGGEAA